MSALEPTLATLSNPFQRYFLATRPAFLSVTFVGCMLGFAIAAQTGAHHDPMSAFAALFLALLAHAGVNVLNDYYDALNGTDAINTERVFPFTGGSRFIQNGVLGLRETLTFGVALFGAVIVGGIWLMLRTGPELVLFGLGGLFVGWAYSAPPLRLDSRGLGEFCVAAGFLLIVAGADFVLRQRIGIFPYILGIPFALLVTNILYINQFPDRKADEASGKRTLVTRLSPKAAATGYLAIAAIAYLWCGALIWLDLLPWLALLAVIPALALSGSAFLSLWKHIDTPSELGPAIQFTIAASISHGLVFAAMLFIS